MIAYSCPLCAADLSAPDGQQGSEHACPSCGHALRVPIALPQAPAREALFAKAIDGKKAPPRRAPLPADGALVVPDHRDRIALPAGGGHPKGLFAKVGAFVLWLAVLAVLGALLCCFSLPWGKGRFFRGSPVSDFDVEYEQWVHHPGHVGRNAYVIRYVGEDRLQDVEVAIALYPKAGAGPQPKWYWETWGPQEGKTVPWDLPFDRMEKIELIGRAKRRGKAVELRVTFFRYQVKGLLKK